MELRKALKCGQLGIYPLGMLGSLIIIKIMLRPTFRQMPRSLVYTALALINLLFLIYVTMTTIYDIVHGNDPAVLNIYMCTINFPILGFLTHMDAWLLCVLTLERVFCVVRPFHIRQIVNSFRTKILLTTLTLFFLIWNAELAFRMDLLNVTDPQTNVTSQVCQIIGDYGQPSKIFLIKGIITTVLLRSVLPAFIIIPSNLVIIVKLLKQKQARSNMLNTCKVTDNQTQNTTLMIVTASLLFVIMSTPLSIYLMIIYTDVFDGRDEILPILALIYRLSPVVNFYCYFLSGGLFKQEVKTWLSEVLRGSGRTQKKSTEMRVYSVQCP